MGLVVRLAGLAISFWVLAVLPSKAEDACIEDDTALAALDYAFGNTIRLTGAGETIEIYFDCDGTFATRSSVAGDRFGRWRVADGEICTKTHGAEESCGPIQVGRAVGDTWTQSIANTEVTLEILPGR